ncbi:MAG: extracellular solute-binding protein [Nitriliruptorales bacterium]|nr:extracellular solute-binding protein [Nitriliruptorales bacterium]
MNTVRGSKISLIALLLAAVTVLAACAQEPPADGADAGADTGTGDGGAPPADGAGGGEGQAALEEVYAELDGLEGEERTNRLVELAEAEEGALSFYTSTNLDESGPMVEGFTDLYDLDVDLYRASSGDLLQRVLQEADAGYAGADVLGTNGTEMQIFSREGLLLPLDTPVNEEIAEAARYDDWLGTYLNVFVAGWNTEQMSEDERPTSWEEVLTDYPGTLAMELGDWDWFSTVVQDHFMEDQGMSEEEAVELFREAARNATVVDGHTPMVELMIAGEFNVVASAYQHRMGSLAAEGAPIAWEPAVEPIVMRPNGIGVHRDTDRPAAALLFTEYMLTDAQEMLPDFERTPANTEYGAISEEYELISVDLDDVLDSREKWEGLYEEIVRLSGSGPVEG